MKRTPKVVEVLEPLIGDYVPAATFNPETRRHHGTILVGAGATQRTVTVGPAPDYVIAHSELVETGTTDPYEATGYSD